jgi:hypothetical protein
LDYHVAKPHDSDDIVCLLATVFSKSEPPAVALGLSCADFERFLWLIVLRAIPDELTIVSRSKGTGKLAGVLLTDDFASPPALDLKQISPKFLPILSLLETLDEQFRRGKTISAGKYLHPFMLGVEGGLRDAGLGKD